MQTSRVDIKNQWFNESGCQRRRGSIPLCHPLLEQLGWLLKNIDYTTCLWECPNLITDGTLYPILKWRPKKKACLLFFLILKDFPTIALLPFSTIPLAQTYFRKGEMQGWSMALHTHPTPPLKKTVLMPTHKQMEADCFPNSWQLLQKRRQKDGKQHITTQRAKAERPNANLWQRRSQLPELGEQFPCGPKRQPHHIHRSKSFQSNPDSFPLCHSVVMPYVPPSLFRRHCYRT